MKIQCMLIALCTFLVPTIVRADKLVYLKPPQGLEHESFFNLDRPLTDADMRSKNLIDIKRHLVKQGCEVKIMTYDTKLSPAAAIIIFNMPPPTPEIGMRLRKLARKMIFVLTEPPSVVPMSYEHQAHRFFDVVLTMDDSMVDNKKYFKFYYPIPSFNQVNQSVPFSQKRLCNLIASNRGSSHPHQLYSARLDVIRYFEKYHAREFDLYGPGWKDFHFQTYKGVAHGKASVQPLYKFAICYENIQSVHGYITEKIFDCFCNRCVPIYWGAPNVTRYIPPTCFIDRRHFSTHDKLYAFLKNMSHKTYATYQQEITRFLATKEVKRFSIDNFVNAITRHIPK